MSSIPKYERHTLTLSEATQLILFAVHEGWDDHGNGQWAYDYLKDATGREIPTGDFDTVYELYDAWQHTKSCDLAYWFDGLKNTEENRQPIMEHAEDELNAAVFTLASLISPEIGKSPLPAIADEFEFYEVDGDRQNDLAWDDAVERRMAAGL